MKLLEKVTEEDIMSFDNVPAQIAAKYLGVTPQAARCLAKVGKIGCKRLFELNNNSRASCNGAS